MIEDGKVLNNNFFNEGRDSNAILQEIFGVEKRPKEFGDKLAHFYTLLENQKVAEAEKILQELSEKWGTLDAEIVRATLYFQDTLDEVVA